MVILTQDEIKALIDSEHTLVRFRCDIEDILEAWTQQAEESNENPYLASMIHAVEILKERLEKTQIQVEQEHLEEPFNKIITNRLKSKSRSLKTIQLLTWLENERDAYCRLWRLDDTNFRAMHFFEAYEIIRAKFIKIIESDEENDE